MRVDLLSHSYNMFAPFVNYYIADKLNDLYLFLHNLLSYQITQILRIISLRLSDSERLYHSIS